LSQQRLRALIRERVMTAGGTTESHHVAAAREHARAASILEARARGDTGLRLLEIVKPAHQQVFDLHQQGLSVHQIASRLGRSERGVRTIIRKAEIRIARIRSIATRAASYMGRADRFRRE
jgi:DNA-binding NarL/FixJ family response regulator